MNNNSHDILVVEDDSILCELLKLVLKLHGYKAFFAHDGQQAVNFLSNGGSAKLVLLDMMMPVMDGKSFLQWLRKQLPPICKMQVIILSALSIDETESYSGLPKEQFTAILRKPISVQILLPAIHQALHANA